MSACAPTKINDLFNKIHLPHDDCDARSRIMKILDNRVTAAAFKILSKVSAVVGVSAAFIATVLTGVGSIPFIFVAGCLTVHAISHFISKKMRMLFNPEALRKNQEQAAAYVLSLKFLSDVALFQQGCDDKDIKAKFIRPLTVLIQKYTALDLIGYRILPESLLVQAFLTEIKHQDFSSSVALYQTVLKAFEKKALCDYVAFKEKVLPALKEKGHKLQRLLGQHDDNVPCNTFSFFYNYSEDLAQKFMALDGGIEAGIIDDGKGLQKAIKNWLKEQKSVIKLKNQERFLKPVNRVLQKQKVALKEFEKFYAGNECHDIVEAKQKEFISSLELIYMNKKERDDKILAEYGFNISPIEIREDDQKDQRLIEAFSKIKDKKLHQSLDLARLEMETLVERHVGDDFLAINKQLQKEFDEMESRKTKRLSTFQADLDKVCDYDHAFVVKYQVRLEAFKQLTRSVLDLV